MSFDIVVMGDLDMMYNMFTALALMFNDGSMQGAFAMLFMASVLILAAKTNLTGKFELYQVMVPMLLVLGGVYTKVDVNLYQVATSQYKGPVGDVPVIAAAPYALVSQIGSKLAQLFETAATVPGQYEAGYLDPLAKILELRQLDANKIDASKDISATGARPMASMKRYLEDCYQVKVNSDDGPQTRWSDLLAAPDAFAAAETDYVNIYTEYYYATGSLSGPPGPYDFVVDCKTAYSLLLTDISDGSDARLALDSMAKIKSNRFGHYSNPPASVKDFINNYTTAINAGGIDAESTVRNLVVRDALKNTVMTENDIKIDPYQLLKSVVMSTALQQQDIQFAAEKQLFENYAQPLMAFMEIFIVGSVPMALLFMAFSPKGVAMIGKYGEVLIWISMWHPVLAMCNLFIYTKLGEMTLDAQSLYAGSGSSLAAIGDTLFTPASHWLAVGGMLAASTPVLAAMLVYGGVHSALSLAGKLSRSDTFEEKALAPDAYKPAPLVQGESPYVRTSTVGNDGNFGANIYETAGATGGVRIGGGYLASSIDQMSRQKMKARSDSMSDTLNRAGSSSHIMDYGNNREAGTSYKGLFSVSDKDSMGNNGSIFSNSAEQDRFGRIAEMSFRNATMKGVAEVQAGRLKPDQLAGYVTRTATQTIADLANMFGFKAAGSAEKAKTMAQGWINNAVAGGELGKVRTTQDAIDQAVKITSSNRHQLSAMYGDQVSRNLTDTVSEMSALASTESYTTSFGVQDSMTAPQWAAEFKKKSPEELHELAKATEKDFFDMAKSQPGLLAPYKDMLETGGGEVGSAIRGATKDQDARKLIAMMAVAGSRPLASKIAGGSMIGNSQIPSLDPGKPLAITPGLGNGAPGQSDQMASVGSSLKPEAGVSPNSAPLNVPKEVKLAKQEASTPNVKSKQAITASLMDGTVAAKDAAPVANSALNYLKQFSSDADMAGFEVFRKMANGTGEQARWASTALLRVATAAGKANETLGKQGFNGNLFGQATGAFGKLGDDAKNMDPDTAKAVALAVAGPAALNLASAAVGGAVAGHVVKKGAAAAAGKTIVQKPSKPSGKGGGKWAALTALVVSSMVASDDAEAKERKEGDASKDDGGRIAEWGHIVFDAMTRVELSSQNLNADNDAIMREMHKQAQQDELAAKRKN